MAKKRDFWATLNQLRNSVAQDSADTIARIAQVRSEMRQGFEAVNQRFDSLKEQFEALGKEFGGLKETSEVQFGLLEEAVKKQSTGLNQALETLMELVGEHQAETSKTLQDHEERLRRLEDGQSSSAA